MVCLFLELLSTKLLLRCITSLPKFIKETGVDKVNTVFLTDGESNGIGRVVKMSRDYYPEGTLGKISVGGSCQLRDVKKGRTYTTFL